MEGWRLTFIRIGGVLQCSGRPTGLLMILSQHVPYFVTNYVPYYIFGQEEGNVFLFVNSIFSLAN